MIFFADRTEAGNLLAQKLKKYFQNKNTIVLGLPRGGVVTANAVAKQLDLPLDILIVKKIGAPGNEELALGAVAEDGTLYWDMETFKYFSINKSILNMLVNDQNKLISQRIEKYRQSKPLVNLLNKIVILVDDGIATGSTMIAAIKLLQKHKCEKIVIAVPVTPSDALKKISNMADEFVFLDAPLNFAGVGNFYKNFKQTTDDDVLEILNHRKKIIS